MSVKKVLKSESREAVVYDVTADSIDEFLTHKQNIPIYIIMALCVIAHIWAWITIE